ncbi:MAG: glycosyltransferase family 2 protein [Planctomycetota bacterium]|nr:glycosyltransferase family 2 protein [Planctomycetota bacterium]
MRSLGPVSAVVCNYEGERYLADCLESLLTQEDPPDEVIVVDNGSTDGGVALIRERFPWVRVVELGENTGASGARNVGMRTAKHRWVLAVDNDTVLRPDVLSKLRAALEADADAVAAQTRNVFADEESRVHYDGGRFHYAGLYSLRNFQRPLAEAEGAGVLVADGLIAICLLLDRDTVLEVGGYDEDFFVLYEDLDLSLRLRLAGHRLLSVEDAIVLHKGGTAGISFRSGSYPRERVRLHSRNRWLLLLKNYHWRTLVLCFPGILVYELAWLLFTLLRGHSFAYLTGKVDFLRCARRALERRREVQARRTMRDRDLLVGGPLTLTPRLTHSGAAGLAARVLCAVLAGWWRVVRPFCA